MRKEHANFLVGAAYTLALLGGAVWLFPSPPPTASTETRRFHEYDCTDDCSGHEAGWEWAEGQGITDEEDCGGDSDSFIEGCEAYVQEGQEPEDDDREIGLF